MSIGWVKLHRKLLESPVFRDPVLLKLWVYLLLECNHKEGQHIVGSKVVVIKTGCIMTGRKALGRALNVNESKIERMLKTLEILKQIEQQTFTKYRIISITNWCKYQGSEQQVNNKRTTSEQQVNTNKNVKNVKKGEKDKKTCRFAPPSTKELQDYISEKQLNIDHDSFINFYKSKNWMVGKNKMKDWKASARGWHSRSKPKNDNINNMKAFE